MTAWIVGLLVLVVLLWLTTELSLRQEEQRLRSHTMHQASSLSNSYATQLRLLAEQMNQILRGIEVKWSDTPATMDLERDRRHGLFPDRGDFLSTYLTSRVRRSRPPARRMKKTASFRVDFSKNIKMPAALVC